MARLLVVLGLVLLVAGLLWPYLSQIGLGRLPGDIVIQRKNVTFLFSADDMSSAERAVQPGVLGREPLKRRSCHRAECRAPRAAFPGEAARVRFDAGAPFRASSMSCRCATAFSMS
jgi:hypothetical protein